MLYPRNIFRFVSAQLPALAMIALPVVAMAADTPTLAAATHKSATGTVALDLRAPPITAVMTAEQIDEVLSRTLQPRDIEEVEVDSSRVYDPDSGTYIPPGFAALFWAAGKPSGLWRLFTPRLAQRDRVNIDPTRGEGPAPGIPAMAGEERRYDR